MNRLLDKLPAKQKKMLRKQRTPKWTAPMLATLTKERFSDFDWIFERKLDGERCLVIRDRHGVRLLSRNRQRLNDSYPELVSARCCWDITRAKHCTMRARWAPASINRRCRIFPPSLNRASAANALSVNNRQPAVKVCTGSNPLLSRRSGSPNGLVTGVCDTRASLVCAQTNQRPRSSRSVPTADDKRRIKIDGHWLELSNKDKIMFPENGGITKGRLIEHYRAVAEPLLRHARGRPLTLHRFPDGIDKDGFYQQERPDYFPGWVGSSRVQRNDGSKFEHTVCNNEAALAYLANQGVITMHGWLSRQSRITKPDRMIYDLDPPGDELSVVVEAARSVRALMQDLDLPAYVMTTGSRGLHVCVPLDATANFDDVRAFAQISAELLASRDPDQLTTEQRNEKRRGQLYLDVMCNGRGQTAVLPYCTRALPGAPVATPLDWDELSESTFDAQRYNLWNIQRRMRQKEDPWVDMDTAARGIVQARAALDSLRNGQ